MWSSLVRTHSAQFLLALEENEAYRNLPFLMEGGTMVANADSGRFPVDKVRVYLEKNQITCHSVSAGAIAQELGVPLSSNLALLGFFSGFDDALFSHSELKPRCKDQSERSRKISDIRRWFRKSDQGEGCVNEIAGILLAAGSSTRMGSPKQLLPAGIQNLLDRSLTQALQSDLHCVVLVLGFKAWEMEQSLGSINREHPKLRIIFNEKYEEGSHVPHPRAKAVEQEYEHLCSS
jgi:hypothetical protein